MIRENVPNRQSVIFAELKGSFEKLSFLDQKDEIGNKARQTLMNRTSNLADLKYVPSSQNFLDQELLVNLISDEVGNWKKDLLGDYIKIAEKAEKELRNMDTEKTHLIADKNQLMGNVQTLKKEIKMIKDEYGKIEGNLKHYLGEFENQTEQLFRLRENYSQYEKLHENIEKSLKTQLLKLTEESEKKIEELLNSLEKSTNEKNKLLKEKMQLNSSQISVEEFQKYQSEQIAELTVKSSKLSLENESMRSKISLLFCENSNFLEEINDLKDEIIKLRNQYQLELDQTTKTYEMKLKQQEPLLRESRSQACEPRVTELFSLQVPEMDVYNELMRDPEFYERDRTTTDLDRLNFINKEEQFSGKMFNNKVDFCEKEKMVILEKSEIMMDEDLSLNERNSIDYNFYVF